MRRNQNRLHYTPPSSHRSVWDMNRRIKGKRSRNLILWIHSRLRRIIGNRWGRVLPDWGISVRTEENGESGFSSQWPEKFEVDAHISHAAGYPVRGQRTKTNAVTAGELNKVNRRRFSTAIGGFNGTSGSVSSIVTRPFTSSNVLSALRSLPSAW